MIIYKKYGVDILPKKFWWIANNILFLPFFLLPALIMLIFFRGGTYYFGIFWLVAGLVTFLTIGRKMRPLLMEIQDDTIHFTYSTLLSVVDVDMKTEQLNIEVSTNKYFTTAISKGDTKHQLYFTSVNDESVFVEIGEPFYTIGKILTELERSEKVYLGDKELALAAKYRAQIEKERSPARRAMNILILLIIISTVGFIVYNAIQNFLEL